MPAEHALTPEQVAELFPKLDNIRLTGLKGPQQIFNATLKSNLSEVILRLVPNAETEIFGWNTDFITSCQAITELDAPGLLKVYGTGQAGDFTYILSQEGPYTRLSDLQSVPRMNAETATSLVRDMAEGIKTLHDKGIYHGGITSKLIGVSPDGQDALLLPINIYPAQPPEEMEDFAAPEWVTGAATRFTPAMDVYALGVTLYIFLTGKTPMQANFVMPSTLIKCSTLIDNAVANAIEPDENKRYQSLSAFITDLNKALSLNTNRNKLAVNPPTPIMSVPHTKLSTPSQQGGSFAFYFIPALIIALVFSYTAMLYKQDVSKIQIERNAQITKKNKAVKKQIREGKVNPPSPAIESDTTTPIETDTPVIKDTPAVSKPTAVMQAPAFALPAPGHINWCKKEGVKIRMSSVLNDDDSYAEKAAIDGNINSDASENSVSVTGEPNGKTAYFGVDFGKKNNPTLSKIVIYTPGNRDDLPGMEKFTVHLYNSDKDVLGYRNFTVNSLNQTSNVCVWELDPAMPVRALRITTPNNTPIAITEIQAFGPLKEQKTSSHSSSSSSSSDQQYPEGERDEDFCDDE